MATLYVTSTTGHVYQCKDGPESLYCPYFAPGWRSESFGGGSVHTAPDGALGWKYVGDCDGESVTLVANNGGNSSTSTTDGSEVTWPEPAADSEDTTISVGSINFEKSTAVPKPSGLQGNHDGDDTGGTSTSRQTGPIVHSVQQAPPAHDDESMIEKDGRMCWRSGRRCNSLAQIFACCTKCINGICI